MTPLSRSSVNNFRVLLTTVEDALKNRLRTATENASKDETRPANGINVVESNGNRISGGKSVPCINGI